MQSHLRQRNVLSDSKLKKLSIFSRSLGSARLAGCFTMVMVLWLESPLKVDTVEGDVDMRSDC